MKILIDNRDLPYTIDTYGTFTMDSATDYILDDDEFSDQELTYDDFDWTYDMDGYRKALAEKSIDLILGQVDHDIVKSIKFKDTKHPQFYNYTTDSYTAEWDIDTKRLKEYILQSDEMLDKYTNWLVDNWRDGEKFDKTSKEYDKEYATCARLDFYLQQIYDQDEYIDDMFEQDIEMSMEFIEFKELKKGVKL